MKNSPKTVRWISKISPKIGSWKSKKLAQQFEVEIEKLNKEHKDFSYKLDVATWEIENLKQDCTDFKNKLKISILQYMGNYILDDIFRGASSIFVGQGIRHINKGIVGQ